MESLPRKRPEQNGTGLDFDSGSMTEIMLDPGSSAFVPGMSAWTPKAASYRIALPFQARKRFLGGARQGEVMHGAFGPQQQMRQSGL